MHDPEIFIALDIGLARTGVAAANSIARIARPLTVIPQGEDFLDQLTRLLQEQNATALILGLPRNQQGQDTAQTKVVREYAADIRQRINLPLYLVDEAMTSVKAEQELRARKKPYTKGDIDMLAAVYILEDFLNRPLEAHETA